MPFINTVPDPRDGSVRPAKKFKKLKILLNKNMFTYVVLPQPVGPMITLRPDLNIPLKMKRVDKLLKMIQLYSKPKNVILINHYHSFNIKNFKNLYDIRRKENRYYNI